MKSNIKSCKITQVCLILSVCVRSSVNPRNQEIIKDVSYLKNPRCWQLWLPVCFQVRIKLDWTEYLSNIFLDKTHIVGVNNQAFVISWYYSQHTNHPALWSPDFCSQNKISFLIFSSKYLNARNSFPLRRAAHFGCNGRFLWAHRWIWPADGRV